jgi:glycine cleavage system aminomethyltransferase T
LAADPSAPLLYHGEVLWRNGERISDIRSGSYGHTVGGGVGLTMLRRREGGGGGSSGNEGLPIDKAFVNDGEWHLEIADQLYPCQVSLSSLYDPKNTRIKG